MSEAWPQVELGAVLDRSKERVDIRPDRMYKQITVRLWGKGVVLRNEVPGTKIRAKRRYVAREGQFILSRIDARNGAFGLVPDFLDGGAVTNDFPVFNMDESRLFPPFLEWMSKTRRFVRLCKRASEGTTNRVRIQLDRFLASTLALPTLDEQRRIVARIEALVDKVEAARRLRKQVQEEVKRLCRVIIFDPLVEVIPTPMRELVRLREPDVSVHPTEIYHFAGVYSFGRGVFRSKRKTGSEFSYKRLTKLSTDNFVYPKLMAWEGALGIVPPECNGLVVSPEFPVFEIDESKVLPETLDVYFRTPSVWPLLAGVSTGTNVRRRRLHPRVFLSYEFPLPPMRVQVKLREINDELTKIRQLQEETVIGLDALLPSILDQAFRGEL